MSLFSETHFPLCHSLKGEKLWYEFSVYGFLTISHHIKACRPEFTDLTFFRTLFFHINTKVLTDYVAFPEILFSEIGNAFLDFLKFSEMFLPPPPPPPFSPILFGSPHRLFSTRE